jgi:hypothetical protein
MVVTVRAVVAHRHRHEAKSEAARLLGRLRPALLASQAARPDPDQALPLVLNILTSPLTFPPFCWSTHRVDLQLTRYDEKGWRGTFYATGIEHALTRATGTAWERTPWHAAQRAVWEAWKKVRSES